MGKNPKSYLLQLAQIWVLLISPASTGTRLGPPDQSINHATTSYWWCHSGDMPRLAEVSINNIDVYIFAYFFKCFLFVYGLFMFLFVLGWFAFFQLLFFEGTQVPPIDFHYNHQVIPPPTIFIKASGRDVPNPSEFQHFFRT